MNSDVGFVIGSTKQTQISNGWSWNNGRLQGDDVVLKLATVKSWTPANV
jgi:hypothetical protein